MGPPFKDLETSVVKMIILLVGGASALLALWLKNKKAIPPGAKALPGPKGKRGFPISALRY